MQVYRTNLFSTQNLVLLEYVWPTVLHDHLVDILLQLYQVPGLMFGNLTILLNMKCWAEHAINYTRWLCRDHIPFIVTVEILEAIVIRIPTIYKLILLLHFIFSFTVTLLTQGKFSELPCWEKVNCLFRCWMERECLIFQLHHSL